MCNPLILELSFYLVYTGKPFIFILAKLPPRKPADDADIIKFMSYSDAETVYNFDKSTFLYNITYPLWTARSASLASHSVLDKSCPIFSIT